MAVVTEDGKVTLADGDVVAERLACHCDECWNDLKGPKWAEERYSLGIYAGKMCDAAWDKSGYRKEGPEGFDPDYAGERYEDDC